MQMENLVTVSLWLDGTFKHSPNLSYVGGRKQVTTRISLDYMNMDSLYALYRLCGGKKLNVTFYFVYAGQSLEHGLRQILYDVSIAWLVSVHEGLDHLTLYTEDTGIEPLLAVDRDGNVLREEVEILYLQQGDEEVHSSEAPFEEPLNDEEPNVEDQEAEEPSVGNQADAEPTVEDQEAEEPSVGNQAAAEPTVEHQEAAEPTVENQADEEANVDSEDDDSADDDYLQPEDATSDENDVHSDVPSEELDDVGDRAFINGYELEYVKNERKRVTAECKTEGCNWRIHASVVQGGPTFQIKSITGEHTC
ncbi:PREDICTED: uncharacterized protein LOC105958176 [Erythranthe guttata]|uniref:uncharacterized protein LOC105958176 n=1 Tax=Erythranthe guttata TaxID=4155 RepID=UPI00064E029F|nr:PREDICTED: uncharacterized protein LOC105958176 [Erythranthe guttata]|eukprot:XP_012837639.1 PREDICTED: uncharacterized protein LOC105958176 [Erythranthe guttata]